ncbi:MAG: hypothetical protein IKF54_01390, partial [Eubacterium sp.]|nr:hypothetical protein [Eubacterium sp.]
MNSGEGTTQHSLDPYLTRLGIWAFSIGTSIGWGSFIVTCNTYLLLTYFVLMFLIAVFLMLGNYMTANKREHALITELDEEKEAGLKDPLTGVKNKKAYLSSGAGKTRVSRTYSSGLTER